MRYVGIDPGKGGGLAALDDEGRVVWVAAMPATERDLLDALGELGEHRSAAVIEFVRASPQMGVVSAWTFGVGYGGLRMALTATHIPFDEVVPRKWQDAMRCRTGGDKNISKRRAQELFPDVKKITHATADALLLAEYCRRVRTGESVRKVS